jgi:vacuolar-type H+-ATPase subunit H
MSLRETAENLVEFARHSKQEELDNVVMAIVNFAREQRIEILEETLQLLQRGADETILSQRKRQETTKLSEGKAI